MPTLVWPDRTAFLDTRPSASGVALAEALQSVSHDRLTRWVQADGSGPRLLDLTDRPWCVWTRGELIIEDPVRATPVATALERLAGVSSSRAHQPVQGRSRVLWVWTTGTVRLPLGLRLWPTGGPSKDDLALAWLRDARNRLRGPPADGLLAAWQPARRLLKQLRDEGWSCVWRLTKTRRCQGHAVRHHRRPPDGTELAGCAAASPSGWSETASRTPPPIA